MALLLSCEGLSKSFGMRTLFRGISMSIADGERVGMIGPNGSGKSTLLKIMAGIEQPDEGSFIRRRQLRMAYVTQEDKFEEGATVLSATLEGLKDSHIDEHDQQVKAYILLSKMGFTDSDKLASQLSGGWRKRLSIARAIATEPELLLLDEPTNHLDLEGIYWMEKFLVEAPFAFLMISHDRYILEHATNRVIELSQSYPDGYLSINGPYSEFLDRRADFLEGQASLEQALAGKVRREVEWLRRGAKARTTKAKGRIEEANRLIGELADTRQRNTQADSVQVDFTGTGRQTRKLVQTKKVTKTLGGRLLFKDLDLVLAPGSKLGVVGPNGSGKTTLLRLLAGTAEADSGEIRRADNLRVVLFQQDRSSLDKSLKLRDAFGSMDDKIVYRGGTMHITTWAKKFLFRSEQLDQPVGLLSGGEQSRVLIARMMLESADVLILDEPTNDLDIPSLEVLEESMEDFPGALVLVTHDRYMIDRLCDDIMGLDGLGGCGTYAELSQWESAWRKAAAQAAVKDKPAPAKNEPAKKPSTSAVRLSWKEQRELEQMEDVILKAEEEVASLEARTTDPKVMADHRELHEIYEKLHAAQEKTHQLYARWQELEAKRSRA